MTENRKNRILIIEDAKGTAIGYKTILAKADYDVTICPPGKVHLLIDEGKQFDAAIIDIVLPPEDPEKYSLEDCQETGVRLIQSMIENDTCCRFYVITVRNSLMSRVEQLCKGKAALKFESKLDYEPEKLVDKIVNLLSTSIPQ